MSWILDTVRKEEKGNSWIHTESNARRFSEWTNENKRIGRPVYGWASERKQKIANRFSGSLWPLAVGRWFGGLSAPPVWCPFRAEQASGLAGGLDLTDRVWTGENPLNHIAGNGLTKPCYGAVSPIILFYVVGNDLLFTERYCRSLWYARIGQRARYHKEQCQRWATLAVSFEISL